MQSQILNDEVQLRLHSKLARAKALYSLATAPATSRSAPHYAKIIMLPLTEAEFLSFYTEFEQDADLVRLLMEQEYALTQNMLSFYDKNQEKEKALQCKAKLELLETTTF